MTSKSILLRWSGLSLPTVKGSLLATRLVGPPNPIMLVAFGAGKLIEAHIDLFLRAYPSIQACVIINRTANERLYSLINVLRSRDYTHHSDKETDGSKGRQLSRKIVFRGVDSSTLDRDSRSALLRNADIVCTATSSRSPLFTADDIPTTHTKHTHFNLIGSYTPDMHEVDSALIRRAAIVVVDSRVACLGSDGGNGGQGEAGELLKAEMNGEDVVELGELLLREEGDGKNTEHLTKDTPRTRVLSANNGTLTIFKSVGVGVQDVAIAELVVRKAEEMGGVGMRVAEYDVHGNQDV